MVRGTTCAAVEACAREVAEFNRFGAEVVAFTSGNEAMREFMMNLQASVRRLHHPFKFFVAPLDNAAFTALNAITEPNARMLLYDSADMRAGFGSAHSTFRQPEYNRMALAKWDIAVEVLETGRNALMIDPDIAILRDPLGYLDSIPECDIALQLDTPREWAVDMIREQGGFAHDEFDNFYNTGFVLFRNTTATKSFLRRFLQFARDAMGRNIQLDDQSMFDKYLQKYHHVAPDHAVGIADNEVPADAKRRRGDAIADMVMSERCIEYVPNAPLKLFPWNPDLPAQPDWEPAPDEKPITIWPLNNALFPIRPVYQDAKPHTKTAHRPFIVHYNWEVQLPKKKQYMQNDGHWFI